MADKEKVKLEEAKEAIANDIIENKEEVKTKKGFWKFVWKWTKILALPFTVVIALVVFVMKSVVSGKDDDDLDEEPAEEESTES